MQKIAIPIALLSIFLSSCAHDPGPAPIVNLETASCSEAPNLANSVALHFDSKREKNISVVLDSSSSCLVQKNGARVLYKVFSLPKADTPYILLISTIPWGNTLLAPHVDLLNADGDKKRSTVPADFVFRGNSLTTAMRSHQDESYLLVSSDSEVLGRSVSRITGSIQAQVVPAGPFLFMAYTGSDSTANYVLAPAGNISVAVSPFPTK